MNRTLEELERYATQKRLGGRPVPAGAVLPADPATERRARLAGVDFARHDAEQVAMAKRMLRWAATEIDVAPERLLHEATILHAKRLVGELLSILGPYK